MATLHNLGFPRIGAKRELKFALEAYWRNELSAQDLHHAGAQLRETHWAAQAHLDLVPVGDFSFYDHVLDTSFTLSHWPQRFKAHDFSELDQYFRVARGRSAATQSTSVGTSSCDVAAGEMTKWFDTNYHYIVPEFHADDQFTLNATRLLDQVSEAQALGHQVKPVIVGPITYLLLGKAKDATDKLALLPKLLPVYAQLLEQLALMNVEWVQIDEPVLVTDLNDQAQMALSEAYEYLSRSTPNILLATYFGALQDNLSLACSLPVDGLHIDAIHARDEIDRIIQKLPSDRVISLGVINGRNIWKTDLNGTLDWLEPLSQRLGDRLWLAPSCSLIHVPVDLSQETKLDDELKSWLAFALQKLDELQILGRALNHGRDSVAQPLAANEAALQSRRSSPRIHQASVKAALATLTPHMGQRQHGYAHRAAIQAQRLRLPLYPTTTIGSFPQTESIRRARADHKKGLISSPVYRAFMQAEIQKTVSEQEDLGLDVLVHGEAERNDMVEYFGEQLNGYAFSQLGWVQSYGSRCVKPPILFGDISRPHPMTVDWITYAQSLTDKPMKGMLTGPVTMLNWSFVRDDQDRRTTCLQLALALRQEVLDLEAAGIQIIQIDEAALREGMPLRRAQWADYLNWAVLAFRITANGVSDATQIHTHMCYSEFNDIIEPIAAMDADVITIETSRSGMELLNVFDEFDYPNDIGPGVYDIHSPNIPRTEQMVALLRKASQRIPAQRLWVNPDCGLKTRRWSEVIPSLKNMVEAAQSLRVNTQQKQQQASVV